MSRYKNSTKFVTPDPDLAAWCAALASPQPTDEVPPGWHTTRELCALMGKSDSRMGELLRDAVLAGKCEKQTFRIATAGTVRPVPHYRLK